MPRREGKYSEIINFEWMNMYTFLRKKKSGTEQKAFIL